MFMQKKMCCFSSLKYEANQKRRGRTIDWQDLYFPIGCGMVKGGVPPNVPLIKQSDGKYVPVCRKQKKESKFFKKIKKRFENDKNC